MAWWMNKIYVKVKGHSLRQNSLFYLDPITSVWEAD
jgi:hypothetical protein